MTRQMTRLFTIMFVFATTATTANAQFDDGLPMTDQLGGGSGYSPSLLVRSHWLSINIGFMTETRIESISPSESQAFDAASLFKLELDSVRTNVEWLIEAVLAVQQSRLGRYTLVAEHARGGFGAVWRADDTKMGRRIALKRLGRPSWMHIGTPISPNTICLRTIYPKRPFIPRQPFNDWDSSNTRIGGITL